MREFWKDFLEKLRHKAIHRRGANKQDKKGFIIFEVSGGLSLFLAVVKPDLLKKATLTYENTVQVGVCRFWLWSKAKYYQLKFTQMIVLQKP